MEVFLDESSIDPSITSSMRAISKFDGISQDDRSVAHVWKWMGYFYEVRALAHCSGILS